MFSFAEMLGGAGRLLKMPSGSTAAYSGQKFAGENYALFSAAAGRRDAESAVNFFRNTGTDFVVPILPWSSDELVLALERLGLPVRRNYTAMMYSYTAPTQNCGNFIEVSDYSGAEEWGRAVWHGFDGEESVPESYIGFARSLFKNARNSLLLMKQGGKPVCTALIHINGGISGLYYFSTLPRFRRQGMARRFMLAFAEKYMACGMVLLATEEGLPFYKNYGFETLADIPIRCATDDI